MVLKKLLLKKSLLIGKRRDDSDLLVPVLPDVLDDTPGLNRRRILLGRRVALHIYIQQRFLLLTGGSPSLQRTPGRDKSPSPPDTSW